MPFITIASTISQAIARDSISCQTIVPDSSMPLDLRKITLFQ